MNKKIFIFMFLLLASPVFADDSPFRDEVINELPPSLIEVKTTDNTAVAEQRKKNFFKKTQQKNINMAKEIEVVEPDNTESSNTITKKEWQKQQKALKKQQKQAQKAAKKAKNSKVNDETQVTNTLNTEEKEIEAVNKGTSNTVLTDIAYQGSINANEIISVDNCVKLALEHHPAIRSAMGNAEVYKSKIAQAWANFFPTLSAGISYSKNDTQISNYSFPTQVYNMYYMPTLSANMLFFDFGKTKAQADIAKRTYEATEYELQSSINDVIFNCKQAYFNLLFALQQEKVYEDTVKDYELHLEQASAYYNIGTKPKIDVLTAQYNLGNAKLNLIKARNTVKIAYVQLSNSMGMPDYSDYDVKDDLNQKAYNIDIDEAVKTAYETRPELLAAQKKADASELLVRSAKRAFTPDIEGFASYTRGGKKVDTDYGYQFGAQITYSSVNLLLLKKQVDEAKATYKKDLADYENTKQSVYLEVKEAYINLVNAQDSIAVAKLSMEQAKEQYDQAAGRYKVGLGEAIELKDAEVTYRNSQLNYYSTLLDYHVYAANLEKVIGVPLKASDIDLL